MIMSGFAWTGGGRVSHRLLYSDLHRMLALKPRYYQTEEVDTHIVHVIKLSTVKRS